MADEIAINTSLTITKDPLRYSRSESAQASLAASTPARAGGVITVNTTEGLVPIGSVASAGYGIFKNLDATNYVELGIVVSSTFYPLIRLKPGTAVAFHLATNSLYARANTAACRMDYDLFDA
jgi:hypothetical protein